MSLPQPEVSRVVEVAFPPVYTVRKHGGWFARAHLAAEARVASCRASELRVFRGRVIQLSLALNGSETIVVRKLRPRYEVVVIQTGLAKAEFDPKTVTILGAGSSFLQAIIGVGLTVFASERRKPENAVAS